MSLEGGKRSSKHSKSNANINVEKTRRSVDETNIKHVKLGNSEHMKNPTSLKENGKKVELNSSVSNLVHERDHHPGIPSIKASSSYSPSSVKGTSASPLDHVLPPVGKNVKRARRSASALSASKVGENGIVQSHKSSKSRETGNGLANQSITSPVTDSSDESNQEHGALMMQSPLVQVMDRSGEEEGGGEYDPFRIPSAVFEPNKTTSSVEWSVASNESLFSLQLGTSFSRERRTSTEFNKHTEVDSQVSQCPPVSLPHTESRDSAADTETRVSVVDTDTQPSTSMDEIREENTHKIENSDQAIGAAAETTSRDATNEVEYPKERKKKKPVVSTKAKSSDDSGESNDSFEFPIKRKCAWSPCFYCAWPGCYCTWPGCYCARPSCYCGNCSCSVCHCWKCNSKRLCWCSCCHHSPTLSAGIKTTSPKGFGNSVPTVSPSATPQANTTSASSNCLRCCLCKSCNCSSCNPCSCSSCCSSCNLCSCSSCCSSCNLCSCSSCHPCSSCRPCSCFSCNPCSCFSCPTCSCSSCNPCSCSSCCSSCPSCSCSSCFSSHRPFSCCSCSPSSGCSCNPSCCCPCCPSCSCSCRPSCCFQCNTCSCSSCHPCSSCSHCSPCTCSSCENPCRFSPSCCPCICCSCCPCTSCSFHPFSCISCPPFSFSSCDPRTCTSCHQCRSCSCLYSCRSCGSCCRCRRCC